MQKILEPIQMLWVGHSISLMEKLCMQSFLSNGHPVHLYAYNDIENTPHNVTIMDAERVISKKHIFTHKGSYAAFADLFRWKLLYEKGGYYCDTDMLCIKPFDFNDTTIIGLEAHERYNPAVLKFPPKHFLCKTMLEAAQKPLQLVPYDTSKLKRKKIMRKLSPSTKAIGWGETAGPPAMSRAIEYFQLEKELTVKDFTYFYPVSAGNWDSLFDNTLTNETLFSNTHGVHLWNEMIRRSAFDKNQHPDPDSFIGKYFYKYCSFE